jgi:hypothetical protein
MTTETFTAEEVAEVLDDRTPSFQKVETALIRGDMSGLTRDQLYQAKVMLADQMGIDASLSPVDFIPDKKTGRLVPYINSRGAAQLRRKHGLEVTAIEVVTHREGLIVLRCVLRGQDGRTDQALGAAGWLPDMAHDEARAWLVAETRAKRRATMSAVGIFLEGPSEEVEGEP